MLEEDLIVFSNKEKPYVDKIFKNKEHIKILMKGNNKIFGRNIK
jgi:hypothetical protein